MMSIKSMAGASGGYYVDLAREDYYLSGGEPPGIWAGQGALLLGMSGIVEREHFIGMFRGFAPDGRALVQNAGDPDRNPGFDLTFSAPKSVSALWALAGRDAQFEIRAAHNDAVLKTLRYLEDACGFTRRGKDGKTVEKADLVFACFEHGTSRAQDPQLHSHCIAMNITVRPDGTTGTLHCTKRWHEFYRHKMTAGALYRAELAHQMQRRLGLEIRRRDRGMFELACIPEKLVKAFSQRREAILDALHERGLSSAKASAMATLTTRETKQGHILRSDLFEKWRSFATEIVPGIAKNIRSITVGDAPVLGAGDALGATAVEHREALLNAALQEITRNQAHFSERELVRKVAEQSVGRGLNIEAIRELAGAWLNDGAVRLGKFKGERQWTTPEMLRIEKNMLAAADRMRGGATVIERSFERSLDRVFAKMDFLSDEQRAAVRHIVAETGNIACVSGMAGTGKTTMLRAARTAWEAAGHRVLGASLAGKAADGLQQESGIKSRTIAQMLYRLDGKSKSRLRLSRRDVLIVDEAGMTGTRQMARLVEHCERAGAKLVLVGDARQLQPIEAGGPFAAIAGKVGEAAMTDIRRQRDGWHRLAVADMAGGRSRDALRAFAERGMLRVARDRNAAKSDLLHEWRRRGGALSPRDHLILAGTNQDVAGINKEAQAMRLRRGELRSDAFLDGKEERFHLDDRVICTRNSKPLGVRNGSFGRVSNIHPRTGRMTVQLDNGRSASFALREYAHIRLGYAATTHKAQGMTARNAYILTDEMMQDRELSYVQTSRARENTRIFTTETESGADLRELSRSMSRSRRKSIAMELLGERERPSQGHVRRREMPLAL